MGKDVNRYHRNEDFEKRVGFAQAVKVGGLLFVSGAVSSDEHGKIIAPGDFEGQLRQVYDNIEKTLDAHGVGMDRVVKETIYVTDMAQLQRALPIRRERYGDDALPATVWVEVKALPAPQLLIEVEVIVAVD